jgi:hypothetical protein
MKTSLRDRNNPVDVLSCSELMPGWQHPTRTPANRLHAAGGKISVRRAAHYGYFLFLERERDTHHECAQPCNAQAFVADTLTSGMLSLVTTWLMLGMKLARIPDLYVLWEYQKVTNKNPRADASLPACMAICKTKPQTSTNALIVALGFLMHEMPSFLAEAKSEV